MKPEMMDTHRSADGLVGGVMPHGEVGVIQGLFASDALCGVKVEQL